MYVPYTKTTFAKNVNCVYSMCTAVTVFDILYPLRARHKLKQ